jgi:hypothetical protein
VNLLKRTMIVAAGAAMVTGLTVGAAGAAMTARSIPIFPATAVTQVTDFAVPGNGGIWAEDSVIRTVTVTFEGLVPKSNCFNHFPCFSYTASLTDGGSFVSYPNARTPNQHFFGDRIRGIVQGSVSGTGTFGTFYATSVPNSHLVPRQSHSGLIAAATWPKLFFPHGTFFHDLFINPWSIAYTGWTFCGSQTWTDSSSNGFGNLFGDGNINGC